METRLARLEERTENMGNRLDEIKDDVREIRDAIVGARGGWKLMLAAIGFATAMGAALATFLPWLHVK